MKSYLLILFGCGVWMPIAEACTIGSMTETFMQMKAEYKNQTATSFNVRCNKGYNIQFSSRNLRDKYGRSFVNNGSYRLSTRMSILGAKQNLWNTPIAGDVSQTGHKYSVAVQLDERPSFALPAGQYTDELYVSLSF